MVKWDESCEGRDQVCSWCSFSSFTKLNACLGAKDTVGKVLARYQTAEMNGDQGSFFFLLERKRKHKGRADEKMVTGRRP